MPAALLYSWNGYGMERRLEANSSLERPAMRTWPFTYLIDAAPQSRVSTYAYVNPVVAVVLGWLLAGEVITAQTVTGAAVIVGAVAMVTAGVSAHTAREPVPAPVADLAEEPPPS